MPRRLRRIHHVHREHHRPTERAHFEREAQVQAQVGGVDDADDDIGRGFARIEAAAQVARDRLVQARRVQAVGARQVEQRVAAAGRRVEAAFLAFDGHARVVGDLLPAARQQVEQRRLPAIGVADEGDAQACRAALMRPPPRGARPRAAASARRSAKRVKPICTSSGSAPSGPAASTSTCSPATKPSSRRRRAMASFGRVVFDALDGGGDAARQVGQPHGRVAGRPAMANRNCSQE